MLLEYWEPQPDEDRRWLISNDERSTRVFLVLLSDGRIVFRREKKIEGTGWVLWPWEGEPVFDHNDVEFIYEALTYIRLRRFRTAQGATSDFKDFSLPHSSRTKT